MVYLKHAQQQIEVSNTAPIPTKITTQSGSHKGIKKGESVELGHSIPGWTGMIGTPFSDGTRLGVSFATLVGAIFFAVLVVFQLDRKLTYSFDEK